MSGVDQLKVELFADGADLDGMLEMHSKSYIKGLTTNPTLMKKAGITDYTKFAKQVLEKISDKPISFDLVMMWMKCLPREEKLLAGVTMFL